MEQKNLKKESKFIDNVAYKSKFQFLIWVNDNVICQRYFKINGFNDDSIHTEEFINCMNGIVDSIQKDLESKSRVYMWYANAECPLKLTGFLSNEELEKYDEDFIRIMLSSEIGGEITAPDGKKFNKTYINMDYNEEERPSEGEFTFKFSFLVDDVPVFEKIWDGNVYPKFVRNGVDLTNTYGALTTSDRDLSTMNFGSMVIRCMQAGKNNLINEFIRRICDTLSNTFTDKYVYTKEFTIGGKKYNYLSAIEDYKQSWKKAVSKKTREYFDTLYPSNRQIEYIEKNY